MPKISKLLFVFFLCLLSLGQFQRLQLSPQLILYVFDGVIITWLLTVLLSKHRATFFLALKKTLVHPLGGLFIVWLLISALVQHVLFDRSLLPLLYYARYVTYFSFIISIVIVKPFSIPIMKDMWLVTGLTMLALGLVQYFFMPDTRFLAILGWDDHYHRLIGTLFDPGFAGALFIITFWCFEHLEFNTNTALKWLVRSLLVLGIVLTFSRASYLAFVVSLISFGMLSTYKEQSRFKTKPVFLIVAGLFTVLAAATSNTQLEGHNLWRTTSINARVQSALTSLGDFNPVTLLIGSGLFNTTTDSLIVSTARVPDNIFLMALVSSGVMGVLLVSMLLCKILLFLRHQNLYLFSASIGLLVHSQFNNTLLQPMIFLFWVGAIVLYTKEVENYLKA